MNILLIEDEPGLVLTLSDLLKAEGYTVETADDGGRGYELAMQGTSDLILLDLMLPGKSGLNICRDLRNRGKDTPILMLTAKGDTVDKVVGLKMGADDYLSKPFENAELLARVEALLRRGRPTRRGASRYRFGKVTVDTRGAEVKLNAEPLHLSAREYQLLLYFLEHEGELLTRERLMDDVWGYDITVNTRTIDVYIAGLRQKLEPTPSKPRFFQTVHGMGYKFAADG